MFLYYTSSKGNSGNENRNTKKQIKLISLKYCFFYVILIIVLTYLLLSYTLPIVPHLSKDFSDIEYTPIFFFFSFKHFIKSVISNDSSLGINCKILGFNIYIPVLTRKLYSGFSLIVFKLPSL